MSDKPEKKPEAAKDGEHADKPKPKKGNFLTKPPVLLGGVMVIEAAVLFAGFKMFGPKPAPAVGAELTAPDGSGEGKDGEKGGEKKAKTVEIAVGDFKALNRADGRSFLYDMSIVVVVKSEQEAKVTEAFRQAKAQIEDRIRTLIAESDPEKLGGGSEPGLETLRRQVKYQLDRIIGDGLIEEVLVPRCIPFRTDL
jgi:flagellar basal body-associated protein FliL